MLQSMTIRLISVDQLETLYLCYGVKCQSRVIWGHWGQKVVFDKKCYNSSVLHYMTMLISLRPSTYVMGSNVNLGSFGVTGATVSISIYRSSASCGIKLLICIFYTLFWHSLFVCLFVGFFFLLVVFPYSSYDCEFIWFFVLTHVTKF